jgi:hypothetical protein
MDRQFKLITKQYVDTMHRIMEGPDGDALVCVSDAAEDLQEMKHGD